MCIANKPIYAGILHKKVKFVGSVYFQTNHLFEEKPTRCSWWMRRGLSAEEPFLAMSGFFTYLVNFTFILFANGRY
jgi:hypothetical protein